MRVIEEMQAYAHERGCEDFLAVVAETLGYCAEETENLENKNTSARYEIRQMQLNTMIDDPISQSDLRLHREEKQAEEVRSTQTRINNGWERVRAGQIWRENDRRSQRTIEVIAVDTDGGTAVVKNEESGKVTIASLKRFNGSSRGYSLVGGV